MTRHDCAKRRSRMSSAKREFPSCRGCRRWKPRIHSQWKKQRFLGRPHTTSCKRHSFHLENPQRLNCVVERFWRRRVYQEKTGPKKSGAPAWGRGGPESASQIPASFSDQRVGASILHSLSEPGGNDSPE